MRPRSRTRRRSGMALILAMWMVILLTMLVGSLAWQMHMEAELSSQQRKRFHCEQIARSGIQWGMFVLRKSTNPPVEGDDRYDETFRLAAVNLSNGVGVRGLTLPLGEGEFSVDIMPEQGRVNVNTMTEEDWDLLLTTAGVPDDLHDSLKGAFFDWTDPNDLSRLNGAESDDDFYRDAGYKVKNAPLDTIDELLLIKGFGPALLYGGRGLREGDPPISGIGRLLTTWGDGKVNVNTATREAMLAMPEFDEYAVDSFLDGRLGPDGIEGTEDDGFGSVEEALSYAGLDADYGARITVTEKRYVRITATGKLNNSQARVFAIVMQTGADAAPVFWSEDSQL